MEPTIQSTQPQVWKSSYGRIIFFIMAIISIITIIELFLALYCPCSKITGIDAKAPIPTNLVITYFCWVILPPCWFLCEYVFFYPDQFKLDPEQSADFKYTQKLGGNIWAGMVVLITTVLAYKYGIK